MRHDNRRDRVKSLALTVIVWFVIGSLIGVSMAIGFRHLDKVREAGRQRFVETVATKVVEQMKHHCCVKMEVK